MKRLLFKLITILWYTVKITLAPVVTPTCLQGFQLGKTIKHKQPSRITFYNRLKGTQQCLDLIEPVRAMSVKPDRLWNIKLANVFLHPMQAKNLNFIFYIYIINQIHLIFLHSKCY